MNLTPTASEVTSRSTIRRFALMPAILAGRSADQVRLGVITMVWAM